MIAGGLLAAYDAQLRGIAETGDDVERDGPLVRRVLPSGGFVSYRDLDGIRGPDLDALIARQVAHFAGLGLTFEWKTRGHDEPWDLGERLVRAGLVAGPRETVMVGEAGEMPAERPLPDGVTLREVRDDADLDRIAAMESAVWDEDWSWLAADLRRWRDREAGDVVILVVEAAGEVVSAAWAVFSPGVDFAGLWGGSTRQEWRGRGLYRALVARRAALASARGVRYLQVDATDASRPILQRLGFVAITTTTPYTWAPPAGR